MLYMDFLMCERLGVRYTDWAQWTKWERVHWWAYFALKAEVEAYQAVSGTGQAAGLSFAEWQVLSADQREQVTEYWQQQTLLAPLHETVHSWLRYDAPTRAMKLAFAQRVAQMEHV